MIQVGQDALGGWAWMLFTVNDALVASGDGLDSLEGAVDAASEAWAEARIRGETVGNRPRFTFPDGTG